jgi:hypothetical protein
MAPKQRRQLATGVGLLDPEAREGLQALVWLRMALGREELFQGLWRFMDQRPGRFQGQRLRSALSSA